MWPTGKLYFIKGAQVQVYNSLTKKAEGKPAALSSVFKGL